MQRGGVNGSQEPMQHNGQGDKWRSGGDIRARLCVCVCVLLLLTSGNNCVDISSMAFFVTCCERKGNESRLTVKMFV